MTIKPQHFNWRLAAAAWALLATLLFFAPLRAVDTEVDAANRAYTAGQYEEAAKQFQQLVETRGYSASLCFDLANAEAKAGHVGAAILNYERARYLAPGDRDIDFNLQRERKIAGLEPNSYRWWEIALRGINWSLWLGIMGACLLLIFLAIIGTTYLPAIAAATKLSRRMLSNVFRGILFGGIPLFLLLGYIELSTIGFDNRIEGVIIAPKAATLRLSPFDSADTSGMIPEGELVTVESRHDNYVWIEARDHHFGWVRESDLEPVIKPSN